jgi:hypothetical protein
MKKGQIIKNKKGQIKANFFSKICQTIRFKLAFHKILQVLGRFLQNRLLNIPLFNIQKRPKKHNGQTILILTTNPFQKRPNGKHTSTALGFLICGYCGSRCHQQTMLLTHP